MPHDFTFKDWQAPPKDAAEDRILGWLNESTEEGNIWLKNQRGYSDWKRSMDILSGRNDDPSLVAYRSRINTNRLKHNVREVVGALANIRPMMGYHSDNKSFAELATMFNKVSRALYLKYYYDQSLKEALQYAAATCTGFIRPIYRRPQGGGRAHISLLTYGAPCVLPVQMPSNSDWQEAYAVTLLDEMPIYMAHSLWPKFQDKLHPTTSRYWYSQDIRTAARGNMMKRVFGGVFRKSPDSAQTDLYIPIRYTTIIDNSINTSGHEVLMGDEGASWSYKVPSKGGRVLTGKDSEGRDTFREATEEDARMYPHRRLLISSEDVVMYDGPAFNWHGELDLIPFCVDTWPWEAIGFSLIHDGFELQLGINELERGRMDKVRANLDPALGYDINSVSSKEARQFDPMQPRSRVGFDGAVVDKPFAPVLDAAFYATDPEVAETIAHYEQTMDYQHGIRDIVELAKARALVGKGGGNDVDALMMADGPIVRDISRGMERSLARVGEQQKYLILQFMTTRELMWYVGEDGIASEMMDYDPSSIIPSHLPGEKAHDESQRPIGSIYSQLERARWFADNLQFFLLPHSVHEITQMTQKLLLMQLRMRGAPVDWGTVMTSCNVPDVRIEEGNNVQARFWTEKEQEVMHMLRMAKIAESMGIDPSALAGGKGKEGGKGGRPASGQAPPQQKMKGDGRPTVTESQ